MSRWFRNLHLFLGLFSFPYVLVYGLSSVAMVHQSWISTKPTVSERQVAIRSDEAISVDALMRQLVEKHRLRGELRQVQATPAGFTLRIVRPGTEYQVNYSTGSDVATIQTKRANFIGMLVRLHHMGGLWHDYWLLNIWGAYVGLVSVALILLGLTGIYLWLRMHNERIMGLILLLLNLGFSTTLMVLLRLS